MPFSQGARGAAMAARTTEIFAERVKITHPALPEPLRVVNVRTEGGEYPVPVVSQGEEYLPTGFLLQLPQIDGQSAPTGRVTIGNVDRRIIAALRPLTMPQPVAELAIILLATPDIVEYGPLWLYLTTVSYDARLIEGALTASNPTRKRVPVLRRTPADSPGLF